MSQHNTKYSIVFLTILVSLAVTLAGCRDELILNTVEIPDTDVVIRGEVIFKPLVPVGVQTRAEAPEGTKYRGIRSLCVFFFDIEKKLVKEYSGEVDFTPAPSQGSTHEHVRFNKKVRAGQYYVYAVANISDDEKDSLMKNEGLTVDELKKFHIAWNGDIEDDLEMFGIFKQDDTGNVPGNEEFESDDAPVTITPSTGSMHSWVRRTVSKVTVDFDGTNLKDGVTVYIRNARLRDVASGTFLGVSSAVGDTIVGDSVVKCIPSDYSISYGNGASYSEWPSVTREKTFSPTDVWKDLKVASFHDDGARALPCYENMQGEPEGKSKLQDSDGDGRIDSYEKDSVYDGTYLEVEGYYVANRPEYKSQGKIIYRFMLGKDAVKNFDLIRNHHYKITMRFKDYGNDVDWHIDYAEKYLDATYPEDVNYQGKFFLPHPDYTAANFSNAGHKFDDKNVITVTSFATCDTGNTWIAPEISYTYYSYNDKTGWVKDGNTTGWLTLTEGKLSGDHTKKEYTFVAAMTDPTSVTVNSLFPEGENGSKTSPYNLSNKDGKMKVENTANCYMVGAPGWYCFPLVYGNAISENKNPNTDAYSSKHFVNHLNNHITEPYIIDNKGIDLTHAKVELIWQDANNLVIPSEIIYDPNLFDKKGGIKFHIEKIKEGNAVIALIDTKASEDDFVYIDRGKYGKKGSTRAVWSWHIWATRFGFDFEKTIRVLNHEEEPFDLMPVNLGWCSGGKKIRYYRRRKCEIKFKVGDNEIVRTIEQYPHFAVPRGDHPYYQWGRKDPFVGTNEIWKNKPRWTHDGTKYEEWSDWNPPRLYDDKTNNWKEDKRKTTQECLNVLIKNPDKWHNAPRYPNNPDDIENKEGFHSINKSYDDLWSNNGKKTVYDPCPPGYQVGHDSIFTGFTTSGNNEVMGSYWYDVLEKNMLSDYYNIDSVNSQVLEFYTDTRKIQSIIFPVTGYRDYDDKAQVTSYMYPPENMNGIGFVWTSKAMNEVRSYHLKFERKDLEKKDEDAWQKRGALVFPFEQFFNCDGFAVRPVRVSTE